MIKRVYMVASSTLFGDRFSREINLNFIIFVFSEMFIDGSHANGV